MRPARVLSIVWLALACLLVTAAEVRAQVPRPGPAVAASAAVADKPADEEAADSPRASMRTFLDLCERGRYEEAARFTDVPRGAEKRAPELTQKLYDVLLDRLWVDPEKLSAQALGRKDDALPSGTEELGKISDAKGHPVPVRIVRHESRSPEDEPRWVFSQATMLTIDGLHASLEGRWLRDHLPAPLLERGPEALFYWQWLALPILALGCLAIGRLLASLSGLLARRLTAKRAWGPRLLHRLRRPATMGWAIALFWIFLPYLALTVRAEDLLVRLLRALGYLAFFWALLRAVTVAGDEIADAKWSSARPHIRSVTSVGVRLGKVVVATLAFMVALSQLGYPVTTVIAGLGIGGIALALAAQKTVENVFGSISILIDQPFGVGDTIRVDGVEGTVETIGLRSTRMRTVERTLIIIPNGKLADMRIESLGPRDRMRFSAKLGLARDTTIAQMDGILLGLREQLKQHPTVASEGVFVHLSLIGESSFEVEIAVPVETTDANVFAVVREELLLTCVRAVDAAGAKLAVPARQIFGANAGAGAGAGAS